MFAEFEPLPDPYWIGAQICQVTANVNRSKGPPFQVDDFIPGAKPQKSRRQTPDEMLATFRAATKKPGDT